MKIKVTKDVELEAGSSFFHGDESFKSLLDLLATLKFVATDCYHKKWPTFLGYKQGGYNTLDVESIYIMNVYYNERLAIMVNWKENMSAVVIFENECSLS